MNSMEIEKQIALDNNNIAFLRRSGLLLNTAPQRNN